ncbi:MAG: hypothetical protein KF763_11920 [Cyclobacteriaceae bacterium]|nr:hypothetical protein [Cyclobacteriaceae bacterium]
MPKKIVYLFLALLLPGLIFIFLRKFGKNEFNIPVYYQTGVEDTGTCGAYPVPYRVPDSVMQRIGSENKPVLVVVDTMVEVKRNLTRLRKELHDSFSISYPDPNNAWAFWQDCVFILRKPWTAVLIDTQGQIRGYYTPSTREEADRLLVEIRILLKQY